MDGPLLRVRIRPSRRLFALVLGAHGLAAGAVLGCGLAVWARAALLLIVLASVAGEILSFRRQRAAAPLYAGCDAAGWYIEQTSRSPARLLASSRVLPFGVVLCLHLQKRRCARVLFVAPDSASPEHYRSLRVWLRWREPGVVKNAAVAANRRSGFNS